MPAPRPIEVEVPLGERTYCVRVGRALLPSLGALVRKLPATCNARRALLVADTGLPADTIERARAGLAAPGLAAQSLAVETLAWSPSEDAKSIDTVVRILDALARTRHERHEPVVALGGGIVGDVAGFAAAIYRRGVPVIQCPTTLLAMVDASVGGKTGVNLPVAGGLKKNLVGAFWQPRAVVADVDVLTSLPPRERRAGLAECIKHGLLGGSCAAPDLLGWTIAALPRVRAMEPDALVELVARNVALKAAVVAGDEREEDPRADHGRALLNLGHTFGHAIETLPGLVLDTGHTSPLLHGEAVALGLVAAAHTAHALGQPPELPALVESALRAAELPTRVRGLPAPDRVIDAMLHDKKVAAGRLRLILPEVHPAPAAGAHPATHPATARTTGGTHHGESPIHPVVSARVVSDPPLDAVRAGLRAIGGSSSR